ncbi:hypothetical protein B0H14DRAFT_3730354 [Mycena olivaceomarginata]|nr:hypothetical protein B0H14DRAFT_3730354 [Mycena olivaceomarginata]
MSAANRDPPPIYVPHDWGLPGVTIPLPLNSNREYPRLQPLAWANLKFNPLGLYDLRRRLGVLTKEPGVFVTFQHRFRAADLAWLAAGASADAAGHKVPSQRFFPEQRELRNSLPPGDAGSDARRYFEQEVKTLIWDLGVFFFQVTMWDRTFGGTTIILHANGTCVPGTPALLEYFKAIGYLPPVFLKEHPGSHLAVAHIAQTFIEYVGVPTAVRWTLAGKNEGWPLKQKGDVRTPTPPTALLPFPTSDTTYFFPGRPYQSLPPLPTALPPIEEPEDDMPPSALSQEYGPDPHS